MQEIHSVTGASWHEEIAVQRITGTCPRSHSKFEAEEGRDHGTVSASPVAHLCNRARRRTFRWEEGLGRVRESSRPALLCGTSQHGWLPAWNISSHVPGTTLEPAARQQESDLSAIKKLMAFKWSCFWNWHKPSRLQVAIKGGEGGRWSF